MIVFIINTIVCAIKLLAFSWFTNDQVFFKLIVIILLILGIKLIYNYSKPLEDKLNVIIDYYKIHNKYDKFNCFFLLILYIISFVGGIFYLRYINRNNVLDLKLIWNKFYYSLMYHDVFVNFINIFMILMIIVFYIILLNKIIKFFKRYFIKIHIYYSNLKNNWYDSYIVNTFKYEYDYKTIISSVILKFPKLWNFKFLGFPLDYHLIMLAKSIHYIILIVIVTYDILFNNIILYNIYVVFPYIFLYDMYIRLCNLYDNTDILCSADLTLHAYMYADDKDISIISKEKISIKGEPYSTEGIAKAVFAYLKYGLNAKVLYKSLDNVTDNMYKYNYFQDWKNKNIKLTD